jgi:hypothetical protein
MIDQNILFISAKKNLPHQLYSSEPAQIKLIHQVDVKNSKNSVKSQPGR